MKNKNNAPIMKTIMVTTDGELVDERIDSLESPDFCRLMRTIDNDRILSNLSFRGLQYYIAIQKALGVNEVTVSLQEIQRHFYILFCEGLSEDRVAKIERAGRKEALLNGLISKSKTKRNVFIVNPAVFSTQDRRNHAVTLRMYRDIMDQFEMGATANIVGTVQGDQYIFNAPVTIVTGNSPEMKFRLDNHSFDIVETEDDKNAKE